MATRSVRYDHPNNQVRREHLTQEAGGGATTEYGKFNHFQKIMLVAAHAVVTTAGTTTAHGFDVYVGTASVGTITLGTGAADSNASSGLIATEVPALGEVTVRSLADATGLANIIYEFEVENGALQTDQDVA